MIYYKAKDHIGTQDSLPTDAEEITEEEYNALLEEIRKNAVHIESEYVEEDEVPDLQTLMAQLSDLELAVCELGSVVETAIEEHETALTEIASILTEE